MRKFSILAVCILVLIGAIGSVFCNEYYDAQLRAMGLDPAQVTYFDRNGNQVSQDQFLNSVTQHLLQDNPGTTLQTHENTPHVPQSTNTTSNSVNNNPTKKQALPKITVYFTNLYGNVIGTSQITSGTTIANSQFPTEVSECDGKSFDHWDYDDHELSHDYVVRAIYK